jgi:hypothetical protein
MTAAFLGAAIFSAVFLGVSMGRRPAFVTATTFFLAAFSRCAFAALTLAQRFFVAAMIRAMPALLIRRFGLTGFRVAAGWAGSDSRLALAHLAFCARAIFRLVAALNFLRFREVASGAAGLAGPGSIARSSASFDS